MRDGGRILFIARHLAGALLITILFSKSRADQKKSHLPWFKAMMPFKTRRQLLTQKTMKVLEVHEDPRSGCQLFKIHEMDPCYKIDRVVYREKSQSGRFKEITHEDYFRKKTEIRLADFLIKG